ncbi:MAG: bifunctional phosphopantothenoylcysteine decarboxylase/phosphopantothenate--cysteine ligase CoaBC [Chloroflexi bacterium]|nr:bifunctional phosphopantothenoylcysteine decarboxylase/phosphopantothenate--cysteine ligase CoaBC [Chloroflexota bacterium]MBM3172547.1 bifunctional phosphopantothenoylcysteine decarboxylase/phosphopantothenate--cysteine ligase CoaBC [Chloroflexota bacterium]MBM3175629.1 bifunctional phosphopantothenoylcysteine decarboxylase/phosphopantothenate--cysteine ligase CoaBC [Chloroflexota bacterium]MBM4450353.1 bifunctional phosphopantothenoylcysteine decarboxylase/phosphopantothenate--cysteine liga
MLSDKTVVLGVTGSIAAYKAADLASKLTQAGAKVEVIMTEAATEFITPLTFRNITGRPVVTKMFELVSEYSVEHVALAEAADIVVVAPATANTIAKLAAGIADDMLGCTALATKAPVVIAPAMNVNMYQNQVTQENIARLKARGFTFVGPGYGRLACGDMGLGRLVDVEEILVAVCQVLGKKRGDLAGKRVVVTAGGTQEPVDPVRCLTNRSSGKMGYALAESARDRGAEVVLVTAPCALGKPHGIEVVDVATAEEMFGAVKKAVAKADVLIMAAAVADYRPAMVSKSKIKRQQAASLTLELERTPDILGQVKGEFLRVGFAAESDNLVANARQKLKDKNLDLIVANDITTPGCGIGSDTNQVVIIDPSGKAEKLPLLPKREVADRILTRVAKMLAKKR